MLFCPTVSATTKISRVFFCCRDFMQLSLLGIYSPDTPGIRPISCHPRCQQKRRNRFVKQEVIINQLLLLCIGHVPQSIVLPLEITSQAAQSWKTGTLRMGAEIAFKLSAFVSSSLVSSVMAMTLHGITELKAVSVDLCAPSRQKQAVFVPLHKAWDRYCCLTVVVKCFLPRRIKVTNTTSSILIKDCFPALEKFWNSDRIAPWESILSPGLK